MMPRCGRLLDTNCCSPCFKHSTRLVIYSRCLEELHPQPLQKLLADTPGLAACPEAEHINMLGFKLAGILARCNIKEVIVATVDGSMHCIQLHFMVEELEKIFGGKFERRHLILVRGDFREVSKESVKIARFLSKVERLRRGSATPGCTS